MCRYKSSINFDSKRNGINTKYLRENSDIIKSGLDKYLTNTGAILPYEYNPQKVSDTIIIGKKDLRPYLIKIDKHIYESLIIFDACYAGESIKGKLRISTPFIYSNSHDYPYKNIVYIASSTAQTKAKSGVLSSVLKRCLVNRKTNLTSLRVCMNNQLKHTGQKAVVISKKR